MTRNELNNMLMEVIEEARAINIPVPSNICPELYVNGRPRKRFGCCRREKDKITIEISRFILKCEANIIRNVIAHEVLHSCEGCDNHGALWKSYAARMNYEYEYNIKRTSTFAEMGLDEDKANDINIKYIMKCQKCGKEYPRQRYTCVMKKINAYRCQCGGKLIVYEVKNEK